MRSQADFLRLGAVLGGLGVVLGAFGAHGLKARVDADMLAVFEVAVRYQMYHALAIFGLACGPCWAWSLPWAKRACWAWLFGVAVFSGSLYLMVLTDLKWLGAITPIGGVALIAGWALALLCAKGFKGAGK